MSESVERWFRTSSGLEIERVYDAASGHDRAEEAIGEPGRFPYTRGIHPDMYRGRLWTMRQYAGFGTARETNARFRYLLDSGQTGLSVAFDLPTQMGLDSDDPRAEGEVGRVGVAIDTVEDMEILLDGIPLESVSTSMTINATAAILLALYIAVADGRGVPRDRLSGTVQNDILKEFIARGTFIYPVEPSLRLVTDIFAFCADELPRWNTISISGYHMREAGATAAQELAFTLANGREYVRRAVERDLEVDDFAPRLSFFFAAHNHLFEEVAKFRAARRMWARMMRDEFGASDRGCRLRFHTQTAGSTLTAQQPRNNVVRVTVQALAAVLGGTQSLHTNAFDEALRLPSADAARLALRTQQILAAESGVVETVDPLGGSYYVEALTDRVEEAAAAYLDRVAELGGPAAAIDFMADEIHRAAYRAQLELESGEREVVGVNAHRSEDGDVPERESTEYDELARAQRERLARIRTERDSHLVTQTLETVERAAAEDRNLVPSIVAAVKARATLGEISQALRRCWGTFGGD
ncbi:MAG: methylmalonyl-CoA mutase [Gemmatimonadota bacterium]